MDSIEYVLDIPTVRCIVATILVLINLIGISVALRLELHELQDLPRDEPPPSGGVYVFDIIPDPRPTPTEEREKVHSG